MKYPINYITAAVFAAVSVVDAQAGGPLEILRANGLGNYADLLEFRAPLTLAKLIGRNDITIFAPSNSVTPPANATLRRRDAIGEAIASQQMTDDSPPPPKKRQAQLPDSNFQVRRTFLNDPNFVNIGGENLNIVTNYASPTTPGDVSADIEITTGFGNMVNATGEPIKFNAGIIYVVDSYFTFPGLLSETLATGGASSFVAAIRSENLLSKLDTTPRLTVFAPLSELASNDTVEGHVVYNFLGYTPRLVPGETYGGITITKIGGQFFANGNRIVKSDVPIKNGVAHFVDNLVGSLNGTNGTSTGTPPPVPTGAAATLNGVFIRAFVPLGVGLWLWMVI
ncbi:hypothetical protein K440DRAFT_582783 [Wilcoxina mikolae CBS 423.85]|nr:hypothetical protein K440DRAFT_582783 [Wilcoxina mikolae CBS 423.85]